MAFMQDVVERAVIGNTLMELHGSSYSGVDIEEREHFLVVHAKKGRRRIWIKLNFQNDGAAIYSDWMMGGDDEACVDRMVKFAERFE